MMDKDSLTAVYTVCPVQYAVRTLVFQPLLSMWEQNKFSSKTV